MKALSICQPYPTLILAKAHELPTGVVPKRVENRTWETLYRGPLLIHAGKSTKYLKGWDASKLPPMRFGFIVGMVDLAECFNTCEFMGPESGWNPRIAKQFPWLPKHQHTEGPFCLVLANPRRFENPIPYAGCLGLFNVPDEIVSEAIRKAA